MGLPVMALPWHCDAGWPDCSHGSGSGYSLADAPTVACCVLKAALCVNLRTCGLLMSDVSSRRAAHTRAWFYDGLCDARVALLWTPVAGRGCKSASKQVAASRARANASASCRAPMSANDRTTLVPVSSLCSYGLRDSSEAQWSIPLVGSRDIPRARRHGIQ